MKVTFSQLHKMLFCQHKCSFEVEKSVEDSVLFALGLNAEKYFSIGCQCGK